MLARLPKAWMNDASDSPDSVLVVGSSRDVMNLAAALDEEYDATFVCGREDVIELAAAAGLRACHAALEGGHDLRSLDLDADAAVVAADRDRENLLVVQHLRASADVDSVVVRVNDPDRVDVFESLGVGTICATSVLADSIRTKLAGEA